MDKFRESSKYKTIGEVAKILRLYNKKNGSLSTHTIRFWEKEFKQIKPKIFSGNRRYYDDNLINTLKRIQFLLKDKGMTLIGVKKVLNSENSDIDELYNTTIKQKDIIKSKLKNIKKIITNIKDNNG
jgi:DNA-binding transcriptional MerR regulator